MTDAVAGKPGVKDWITVMRLPFTSVAVAPYLMGAYIAWSYGDMTSMISAAAGAIAVFLICIGCYTLGEVFDNREDLETLKYGRSKFAGGTLLVAQGNLGTKPVLVLSAASFIIAAALGAAIFAIQRSPVLLGLGAFGILSAALYSMPPVRLVKRGFGELFIGICYGWLAVAAGYACASGKLPPNGVLISMPSALTVFNIILINEFPDYEADRATGKSNLLYRVGKKTGGIIYSAAELLSCAFVIWVWAALRGASPIHLVLVIPVVALGVYLAREVGMRKSYEDRARLERICALTIVHNLASTVIVGVLAG